jgi:NADH-ubiquinone oxidoreductase chain 1
VYIFRLMFFICVRGIAVYPVIRRGWASNCKYRILGRLRGVAQMISYEVSLAMVLLRIIWVRERFNLDAIINNQKNILNSVFFFPLLLIWLASRLAETNRTPYDFSEGESELVSGFNTEYGSGGFRLIFMAEYGRIMFISLLIRILFFRSRINLFIFLKMRIIIFWFIWVRATLPRYRYDKLIGLAWKRFLSITLCLFIFYYIVGVYIVYY